MDRNAFFQKLKTAVPNAVLKTGAFDRAKKEPSVWVELKQLREVCQWLASAADETVMGFDWLENVSVIEIEEALLLSYFIRSRRSSETLIVRTTAVPSSRAATVAVPSVTAVWPSAEPLELDAGELFGIEFKGNLAQESSSGRRLLPEGWQGFPMRKSYEFPDSFGGIAHSRPPEVSG